MTLILAPNVEALVGDWLREHPALIALGVNVAGETPRTTTQPWIRVTLIDAPTDAVSGLDYLVEHMLQLDCYAGKTATTLQNGQAEAWNVKATARAVLKAREGTASDGVVVTEIRFDGDARLPDTAMEPARERYVLTVAVRCHGAV